MVPLSSTHHIIFAAIAYPRMGKHSGGHTGEEAAEEQTDSGQRVQTAVPSGSCLSVRGLTAIASTPVAQCRYSRNWIPVATEISGPKRTQ